MEMLPGVLVRTKWQNAITRVDWNFSGCSDLELRHQSSHIPKEKPRKPDVSRTSEMTKEPLLLSPTTIWQKQRDMQKWKGNPQKSHWPRKRALLSFSPPPFPWGKESRGVLLVEAWLLREFGAWISHSSADIYWGILDHSFVPHWIEKEVSREWKRKRTKLGTACSPTIQQGKKKKKKELSMDSGDAIKRGKPDVPSTVFQPRDGSKGRNPTSKTEWDAQASGPGQGPLNQSRAHPCTHWGHHSHERTITTSEVFLSILTWRHTQEENGT